MTILYTTHATATGQGRDGVASVEDGALTLSLSTPKALGGAGGDGTNPEQLFASGYAACFLSALRFVAGRRKQGLPDDTSITVTVGIGPRPEGAGFALDIALSANLPGLDAAIAAKLVEEAHATCPYSHLARAGADVRVSIA
ncbi:organic hydroperoxide resistance protein [Primorskyibacter flagellatus]|uniref:Organic hydroperoxide resistance protein n=1 Tax=Primorskyibacter flagellatus TaxID=1387277 RepID=A0A917A781_9RHOB|nr:organic hydroperoxide resistance protein [Primorskyibacter flagellatus]GGE32601.1 organic hydroperoxide resistance protein [Primorskyibacter flagellatus]